MKRGGFCWLRPLQFLYFPSFGDHANFSDLEAKLRVPPSFSFEFRDAPNPTANCTATKRNNMATNWSSRTVVDLRAELKKRGMSTTGKKADLVERLTTAEAETEVEQTEIAQDEGAGVLNTDNQSASPADAPALESRAESPQETVTKSPSPSPAPAATPAQEGRDTDVSAQPPTTETSADGKMIIPIFYFIPITLFLTNPTRQLRSSRLSSPRMCAVESGGRRVLLPRTANRRTSAPGPVSRATQATSKSKSKSSMEPTWLRKK